MYIYNYYSQLISNKSLHHSVVRYTDTGDDVIYVYIQQVPLSPQKKTDVYQIIVANLRKNIIKL